MSTIGVDVRYAVRMLRKAPSFTVAALLTIALGIGATTAVFTVVDAVLLHPLPYPAEDRLVSVRMIEIGRSHESAVAVPEYEEFVREGRTLSHFSIMQTNGMSLEGGSSPIHVNAAEVSTEFFETLGLKPGLGRGFEPRDAESGKSDVVILSYGLWQRRFGSDPSILGRRLTFDTVPRTVVGIAARGFDYPERVDVWVPHVFGPGDGSDQPRGGFHMFQAVGRLAPKEDARSAETELSGLAKRMKETRPERYEGTRGWAAKVQPLKDSLVGDASRWLLMVACAVGLVLLIASANVANLLLARSSVRQREMAVRVALGAGPGRLARQLLVESCVLSLLGGALGLLLAVWGVDLLLAMHPDRVPRAAEISPDWRVALFALGLSIATGLAFGTAPALYAAATAPSEVLKEAGRGTSGLRTSKARSALLIAQVALAVVLLSGAGLLLRSLRLLTARAPGTDPARVLTARIDLPPARYVDDPSRGRLYADLCDRLERVPTVRAASVARTLPLSGRGVGFTFSFEGRTNAPGAVAPQTEFSQVGPHFFDAIGLTLTRGRVLTERDTAEVPLVGVVNEAFVRRHFPDTDPLGKRIRPEIADKRWVTIVGIVGDARGEALDRDPSPMLYLSVAQAPEIAMSVIVRGSGDGRLLAPLLERELHAIDPDLAVSEVATVEELVEHSLGTRRFAMRLFAAFAAVALLLAAIGIYGVTSYAVAQRTREIGIRIALGAEPSAVTAMVVRYALRLVLLGIAAGLGASFLLGRAIRSLVYGIETHDPGTLGGATLLLLVAAGVAALIPARRAARLSPMTALRTE